MRVRRHNGLSDDESMAPNDFWEFKSHLVPQQSESAAPLLVQENTNPVTPVKNDLQESNVSPKASTSKELLGLLYQGPMDGATIWDRQESALPDSIAAFVLEVVKCVQPKVSLTRVLASLSKYVHSCCSTLQLFFSVLLLLHTHLYI